MMRDDLPQDWSLPAFLDVCFINPPKPVASDQTEVTFLPMSLIEAETGKYHLDDTREYYSVKKGYTGFMQGDILFAKITPCMENGKIVLTDSLLNDIGFGSTELHIIRPKSSLVGKYIYYYLTQKSFRSDAQRSMSGNAGHLRVPKNFIENSVIPIPPLPEQRAIVGKIEELFSELDNGIENLKIAKERLGLYRQSVLKKAFEGGLTEEWRKAQKNLPEAEELLEQIKDARQKHYDDEVVTWKDSVAEWEESGKEGRKPKKPRMLDTSVSDSENILNNLPSLWGKCKVADVISDLTDYHANGSYSVLKENVELFDEPNYAVMIRATNFEKNDFACDLKYINNHAYNFLSKSKLFGGEILVGKIGNAGKVYYMPHISRPASLAMNLFAIRTCLVLSQYFYYQLLSYKQSKQIKGYVKGVGNPTIDKISIRSIDFAVCSLKEQEQVVKEIESRLSVCDRLESDIEENLERAESLRQSILKKAFAGELLTQAELEECRNASDYEPASVLLERIKQEQAATKVTKKKRSKKKTFKKR